MRIALDPYKIRDVPLLELPAVVAELGYEWIELPPREDFIPFFRHPRVDDATVRKFRKALDTSGVGISSLLPLFRWSGPDEDARRAAVRYWKRAIQICADLGVDSMTSEFNGRSEEPDRTPSTSGTTPPASSSTRATCSPTCTSPTPSTAPSPRACSPGRNGPGNPRC